MVNKEFALAPSGTCLALARGCSGSHLGCRRGWHLPPGMTSLNVELTATPARRSAGQDARLYGRRDARRYAKQLPPSDGERKVTVAASRALPAFAPWRRPGFPHP